MARREGRVPEHLPEDLAAENARLHREKPQATGHQWVVESCLGFFASEPGPQTSVMIRFIDEHRDRFTIEFIFYSGEE